MKFVTAFAVFLLLFLFTGCEETFYANPTPKDLGKQTGTGPGDDDNGTGEQDEYHLVPYTHTESFTGSNLQKLDVLMVVDNSGSMSEEIAAVRNQLGNFVARLQARQVVDYQIAITTTNYIAQNIAGGSRLYASTQSGTAGKRVAKSASDANAVQIGRDILTSLPFNSSWSGAEMGILAAMDTIHISGSDFMREKTDLAIITLSDEDDHSDPACSDVESASCKAYARLDVTCPLGDGNCPYLSLNTAKSYFQGLGRSVLYKILVGLPNPVCSTVFTLGTRYINLASLLGFTAGNVCTSVPSGSTLSPLEENLLGIADSISRRGVCFNLTAKATGEDILVSIYSGGSSSPVPEGTNGYLYDTATNAICFSSATILNNTRIDVSYESLKRVH